MIHKLEADGIQFEHDGRKILSDIYVKCETGSITGLLGRNGQGKSCLMKIIYGTLKCEKSVRIDNHHQHDIYRRPDLLRYLPQFNFVPKGLSLKRIFEDFAVDFSSFALRFPEFAAKYKTLIGSLSGGEYRLVELYIILKSQSRFVILDEPFTHLSPLQIDSVKEVIIREKENKGLLISDHLFMHIIDICSSLYVLNNGKTHLTTNMSEIETHGYARF